MAKKFINPIAQVVWDAIEEGKLDSSSLVARKCPNTKEWVLVLYEPKEGHSREECELCLHNGTIEEDIQDTDTFSMEEDE